MASFEPGNRYPKARTTSDYGQFIVPVSTYIIDETYDHISITGGLTHFPPKFAHFFGTCHNFFPLSSVQIIIIPACCLLCVL